MAKRAKKAKAQSPYVKYGKTPYVYSEVYRRWKAAVMAGRDNEARALAAEHQKRFLNLPYLAVA